MPNWVQTSLEITGPQEELDRFASMVKVEEVEDTWLSRRTGEKHTRLEMKIIESFLPCPEELYEVKSPVREEQNELAQQMLEKYGATDWYTWQYENWGVKWGDSQTEIDDSYTTGLFYRFQTPWGSADAAFTKISAMFPELRFQFFYDEEAGFFVGCQVMKNGEIVFDEMFSPAADYNEEVDWDNDESMRKYEDWKNDNIFRIEGKAYSA